MTGHLFVLDQEGPLLLVSGLDQMMSEQDLFQFLLVSAFQWLSMKNFQRQISTMNTLSVSVNLNESHRLKQTLIMALRLQVFNTMSTA